MQVWAIASARATIGGPLRSDRLRRTSARAAAFQSATTVADADAAQTDTATKVVTPAIMRKGIGASWALSVRSVPVGRRIFYKIEPVSSNDLRFVGRKIPICPRGNAAHDEPKWLSYDSYAISAELRLGRGRRPQPALGYFIEQCFVTDFEDAGGLDAIPLNPVEDFGEGLALGLLSATPRDVPETLGDLRRGARSDRGILVAARDQVLERPLAIRKHDDAPDHVLELAHVPAPGILEKPRPRLRRERLVPPVLPVESLEELRRQEEDLFFTLSQRRHTDLDHIQAVVQVFAEVTPGD